MIADTASITLLTGLPGSGKTLRTIKFIKEAHEAGEVVFVCNLNGCKVPHIPFEDPRQWRDIPAGSILVVDEAQQFFRTRRGGDVPEYLTAMETIRHQGVRLVLTTQQPDYLDTHLRGLVGLHEHLVRENGKPASKIYRHNEVMDNVRSDKARSRYDSEVWPYPEELFSLYDSAQVHTVKPRLSSRMKRGLIMAAICVVMVVAIGWKFSGFFSGAKASETGAGALPTAARERSGPVERLTRPTELTAIEKHREDQLREYYANLTARTHTIPWSAPIYDGRAAVAEPRVFCMESGAGVDANGKYSPGSVSCITEQGTRHAMTPQEAKMVARWGEPYNPYRQPEQAPQGVVLQQPEGRVSSAAAPAAAVMDSPQVNGYGDLGIALNPGP